MVAYCVEVDRESAAVDNEGRSAVPQKLFGALALTLIDLLTFGAVDVLVPLHLGAGGTSVGVIAAALGAGAALGAITGPIAGRTVDRIGAQQAMAVLFLIGRYVMHAYVVNTLNLEPPVPSIFEGSER